MISGETVNVMLRVRDARDSFGNDVEEWADSEDVSGVLVVPGACAELAPARPEGVKVALTLHFPKSFKLRLRGAKVVLTGRWAGTYRVIGDPFPYMDANCPPSWDMPVEVEAVDG